MRPREDELIDPEIAEQLDAIDATLAGEPVDPRFAELAELALLLAAERPEGPAPEFAAELDRRVAGRFGREGRSGSPGGAISRGAPRRRWRLGPVLGSAGAALAAAVIAVVVLTSGGARPVDLAAHASAPRAAAPPVRAAVGGLVTKTHVPVTTAVPETAPAPVNRKLTGTFFRGGGVHAAKATSTAPTLPPRAGPPASSGAGGSASSSATPASVSPAPLPNGRKIVQSSVLELGAPGKRIDAVAQEIFFVVRNVNAIVQSSNVSSGTSGYAQFELRVPSPALPQALEQLSRLHYASVISRTDATQDVNSPYLSAQRAITNEGATIARLRAELAAATLESQIVSLRAEIANDKAALARAQSSLTALNRRVDYSNVSVSVQATSTTSRSRAGGFGLGKAGHDALRVLEVIAGVALIALAALVPLGLVVALVWWVALAIQRRRRERALDLA
jgi:hypothetical protein